MTAPFFSIIIPTLNEADYIGRLLEDLLEQTETAFEIIVVDGGSQDKTQEKIEQCAHQLPVIYIKSDRANVSRQRNIGARYAKGTYLVFFDADSQIPPKFLSSIRKHLKTSSCDYLTTYIFSDSKNVYDKAIERLINISIEIGSLIDRPFVVGANFIVSKTVFEKIGGFREEVKYAEDYDLAVRLYEKHYTLDILKSPRLVFSLRRYRHEGRLKVLRKNAQAALHVLTRGPITKDLFDYPMGGAIYRFKQRTQIAPATLAKAQRYIKRFVRLFVE